MLTKCCLRSARTSGYMIKISLNLMHDLHYQKENSDHPLRICDCTQARSSNTKDRNCFAHMHIMTIAAVAYLNILQEFISALCKCNDICRSITEYDWFDWLVLS